MKRRPHPACRMVNKVDKLVKFAMPLEPLYRGENLRRAFQLRYSWTGWLKSAWKKTPTALFSLQWIHFGRKTVCDGLSIVGPMTICKSHLAQSPRCRRFSWLLVPKGDSSIRFASIDGFPGFTRKVSVRSVGDNTSQDVTAYIASQVEKEHFDDPRFRAMLAQFTYVFPAIDLAAPKRVGARSVLVQSAYRPCRRGPQPVLQSFAAFACFMTTP